MKRPRRDGFTLLELLLAISLLSLITGSILAGLNVGRRTWETSRAGEAIDEVENAVRSVAGLLARIYPLQMQTQTAAAPQVQFLGQSDSCRFIALSEGGAQWGGLILTEIGGDVVGQRSDLAIWTGVFRPTEGFSTRREALRKTVVLTDVVSFEISYYGVLEQGRPGVWSATWKNRNGLPKLISVKIGASRLGRVIEAATTIAIRQQ